MDRSFDLLNSKSPIGKGSKSPIYLSILERLRLDKNEIQEYIGSLITFEKERFVKVLDAGYGTGFLGLHQGLEAILGLAEMVLGTTGFNLKYLLAYKISQDHVESFFAAIRSHLGRNTKPTCSQFNTAYTMLMAHAEIKIDGNCLVFESFNDHSFDLQKQESE